MKSESRKKMQKNKERKLKKVQKKPKKKYVKWKFDKSKYVGERDFQDMSMDDMFSVVYEDADVKKEGAANDVPVEKTKVKKKKKAQKPKQNRNKEEEEYEEGEDLVGVGGMDRKQYLDTLKKDDPDFFATMMQDGDLLNLRSSDEEEEEEAEEDQERGGAVFVPPEKLEVDSDDSDMEEEEEGLKKRASNMVIPSMINAWEKQLQMEQPLNAFLELDQAFLAAIESLGTNNKEQEGPSSKYKVEGPQVFNSVVRLCLQCVPGALTAVLRLKTPTDDPAKSKRWSKMRNYIKSYLRHLVMLSECVVEPSVGEVVLTRGILPLLSYYLALPSTCRLLLRHLIKLWSTSAKRVRVVAFIAIFRLSRKLPIPFLEWVLKKLYLSYVQNSKFTSPSTWGLIDFMRLSLAELYALDQAVAYKHAFIYIRQMAFHLRNAIKIKKKEQIQVVYNWQYIHCLYLWAELLGKTHPSPALQPIIYPLTQVAIGTMKLQPTTSFCPLLFHVCYILTELSRHTLTYIPILPFLLEILNRAPLHKKHKKASIKPLDWQCMLRLSHFEMDESAFKDGVVEQVYDGIINYLSVESHTIGFPELVVPVTLELKAFLKKCKVPNYTKKMKQLLDKIKENKEFIENKRKEVTFGISDFKAVKDWEISVKQAGTPLAAYHVSWCKVREKDQLRRISSSVTLDDYQLPTINKKALLDKQKGKEKEDFKDLLSDDDSEEAEDDDDDTRFLLKEERAKVKKKLEKQKMKAEKSKENDNSKGDEEENEEEESNQPLTKKMEVEEDVHEDLEEEDDEDDGKEDEVREMRFSDLESEEEDDDYGAESD